MPPYLVPFAHSVKGFEHLQILVYRMCVLVTAREDCLSLSQRRDKRLEEDARGLGAGLEHPKPGPLEKQRVLLSVFLSWSRWMLGLNPGLLCMLGMSTSASHTPAHVFCPFEVLIQSDGHFHLLWMFR